MEEGFVFQRETGKRRKKTQRSSGKGWRHGNVSEKKGKMKKKGKREWGGLPIREIGKGTKRREPLRSTGGGKKKAFEQFLRGQKWSKGFRIGGSKCKIRKEY